MQLPNLFKKASFSKAETFCSNFPFNCAFSLIVIPMFCNSKGSAQESTLYSSL